MDGFRDTITKEFDAQAMINANSEADAREINEMKEQIGHCDECLKEIRTVNLKNNENVQQMQNLLKQMNTKLSAAPADEDDGECAGKVDELTENIRGLFTQAADESHKDSVRVYRNVQASMIEELDKRVKILSDRLDEIAQKQAADSGNKGHAAMILQVLTLIAAAVGAAAGVLAYLGIVL
jgi:uncharacterized phage infection (PIP) family protein YhgE